MCQSQRRQISPPPRAQLHRACSEGSQPRFALVRRVVPARDQLAVARVVTWRAIALAMILVQAGDAVIGSRIRDRLKTLGPGLTAVANLIALLYFLR